MRPPINEETPVICPKCGKVLTKHVLAFDTPDERRKKQEAIEAAIELHQAGECERS